MAQDSVGAFGDVTPNVAVVVTDGGSVSPLSITTTSLPYGTRGVPYSFQMVATGGRQPYTWSYTGSLPAGLTLNSSTGLISGTPTTGGSFTVTITVRDPDGRTASRSYKVFFQYPPPASGRKRDNLWLPPAPFNPPSASPLNISKPRTILRHRAT
jgi:hypothetical protein